MGWRFVIAACLLAFAAGAWGPACATRPNETPVAETKAAPVPAPVSAAAAQEDPLSRRESGGERGAPPDLFVASVRPVLVARCAPCHETGGKLYEKLPFDNPKVIAEHRAGLLKRLKGDDRAILEAWLKTQPVN